MLKCTVISVYTSFSYSHTQVQRILTVRSVAAADVETELLG